MVLNTIGTKPVALVQQGATNKEKPMKRVIEIRAAEGGEDSKLFVQDLAQAYIKFAHSKG
jgi:protein subunit release factor A